MSAQNKKQTPASRAMQILILLRDHKEGASRQLIIDSLECCRKSVDRAIKSAMHAGMIKTRIGMQVFYFHPENEKTAKSMKLAHKAKSAENQRLAKIRGYERNKIRKAQKYREDILAVNPDAVIRPYNMDDSPFDYKKASKKSRKEFFFPFIKALPERTTWPVLINGAVVRVEL